MTVLEIAELLPGTPAGEGEREIRGVAALDAAGPAELSYAEGPRALEKAVGSSAGCLLVPEGASLPGQTTIAVHNPKLALIRAAEVLHPASPPAPGIHPTAVVALDARLAPDVSVGAHVVIESGVRVGPGTRLGPGKSAADGVGGTAGSAALADASGSCAFALRSTLSVIVTVASAPSRRPTFSLSFR